MRTPPSNPPSPRARERGTMLLVVAFVASAIAVLATISSGRVVSETRRHQGLESETRAYNDAFARIHFAMNLVNNSAYDEENHNLALRGALATPVAPADDDGPEWMRDPQGVTHGVLEGTETRVYRARDYIKRIQKLKGETVRDVDTAAASDSYFVLEAAGRAADAVRLVSALVRENEPFSSFVFFQNRHTLGVSGAPRGLIHTNDRLAFYFPDGNYVDPLSAVNGFSYEAGANAGNTRLADGNDHAAPISLETVDFDDLRGKANLFVGQPGLDAEIRMFSDGRVRIQSFTAPRYQWNEWTSTQQVLTGYRTETVTQTRMVQTGTTTETRTRQAQNGTRTETYTVTVPVTQYREVTKTRQVPVYATRTVTRTRQVRVFVPYDTSGDAGGGTAVGGGGGVAGEYVWVTESYETTETYVSGYNTETYTVWENVQVGTTTETRTRTVPIYVTETYTVQVPVYSPEPYETTVQVPVYDYVTTTQGGWVFLPPTLVSTTTVNVRDAGGTVFVDGRVTRLSGDLNGRLTVVGNEKVRITGNIRYVDNEGDTAMLNGGDYARPYDRNPAYQGQSILGVIGRDDVLITNGVPTQAEINGSLMSVNGRVGIDGFAIDDAGNPVKPYTTGMTQEEKDREYAYDQTSYKTRTFVKESLRRIGGVISNDRILETFIRPRADGTSFVDSGFKRGNMKFDINLLFNPPPNFVQVPRPVLAYYAPVFFVRNHDG